MRRRERPASDGPPPELMLFDARDWPSLACHPECAYWEARGRWSDTHPDDDRLPFDGPDTPWHPELV